MQRWEIFDHTAGAYCYPHKPEECEQCKRDGNAGDYYLASDVDARIELLEKALKSCRLLIGKECASQRQLAGLGDQVLAEIDSVLMER
jgi:hypothetical protein